MKFIDEAPVSNTRRTSDGFLIATARCARVGVQIYTGDELGRSDMETVRVYRPPEEVFAQDSLQSFSHAPVTIDHPSEALTGDNWRTLAVGEVSTTAKQDGEWIMLPLILKDAAAIKAVEEGKRALSAGYSCQLDWTPGTSPEGQEYDAIQRGIKINHLAVVDKARAGARARIGDDANWGAAVHSGLSEMEDGEAAESWERVLDQQGRLRPQIRDKRRDTEADQSAQQLGDEWGQIVARHNREQGGAAR